MIVRALGYPLSEDSVSPFTDIQHSLPGHMVDPSDPSTLITTSQLRAIDEIDRTLLENPMESYQSTWDPSLSTQHGKNARLAEYNGLLEGLPLASLDPFGPMTRGEIAQLEWNLITFLE